jgi:hypothetical protein
VADTSADGCRQVASVNSQGAHVGSFGSARRSSVDAAVATTSSAMQMPSSGTNNVTRTSSSEGSAAKGQSSSGTNNTRHTSEASSIKRTSSTETRVFAHTKSDALATQSDGGVDGKNSNSDRVIHYSIRNLVIVAGDIADVGQYQVSGSGGVSRTSSSSSQHKAEQSTHPNSKVEQIGYSNSKVENSGYSNMGDGRGVFFGRNRGGITQYQGENGSLAVCEQGIVAPRQDRDIGHTEIL